jgi:hypothetical protein
MDELAIAFVNGDYTTTSKREDLVAVGGGLSHTLGCCIDKGEKLRVRCYRCRCGDGDQLTG